MKKSPSPRPTSVALAPLLAPALAATLLAGCGEDSTSPPAPTALVRTTSQQIDAFPAAVTGSAPSVQVTDGRGRPVAGVEVHFTVTMGAGTVATPVDTSDADGRASADAWTVGSAYETNVVLVTSPRIRDASVQFNADVVAPAAIARAGTGALGGVAGAVLSPVPGVRVVARGNVPYPNALVTFTVVNAGGVLGTTSARTNAEGIATPVSWRLGGRAGEQHVAAAVTGMNGATHSTALTATATAGAPVSIEKRAGDQQSATANAATAIAPRIRVVDAYGNGVPGVAVAFTVTKGGGRVTGGTTTTGASGDATVGSWVLGAASGINTLRASAGTLAVEFAATGIAAGDGYFVLGSGGDQLARVGTAARPVSVSLRNAGGAPVAGAAVTFAVVTGGGSLANATVTSDAGGVATLDGWTLGSVAGVQEVTASAPGAAPLLVRARAYPASNFDIALRFMDTPTARQQQSFDNAVARWRQLIVGDLGDITITAPGTPVNACFTGMPSVAETIDDLLIFVRLIAIDGPGQVLGSARPCFVRSQGRSTLIGVMTFDVADLATLESRNELDAVILHEMGHVLGIGSSWETFAFVQGRGGLDPFYTGQHTTAGFAASGGAIYSGNPVPIDNSTGPNAGGTRDVHWREPTLGRELMTGYFNSGAPNPLSIISVASLADMGYQVSYIAADPYAVPGSEAAGSLMGMQASPRQLIEAPPTGEQFVWDATARVAVPISKWTKGFTRPDVRNPKPTPPPPPGPRSSRATP